MKNFRNLGSEAILPLFIVLLAAGVALLEPRFLSASNLRNLMSQIAPLTILAVGQAIVIIAGGLDLSIAAILALSGVMGVLAMPAVGMVGGMFVMVLVGALAGLVNGLLISRLRASPFIVTLGVASICEAIALVLSNGVPLYGVPETMASTIGFGRIFGINVVFLIAMAVLGLGAVLLNYSVLGRYIYATGSNQNAAFRSGVNVPAVTLSVYLISGSLAGIAAIVMTAWVSAASPVASPGITLQSVAAVILGGVLLTGGSGGMRHVLYGVIVLGTLSNSMNMLGISSYYQILAVGLVILAAVSLDVFRHRRHVS